MMNGSAMSSLKSKYMEVLCAFVNARFTKSQLQDMCRKRGVKVKEGKKNLIRKVIELYSPIELFRYSKILEHLRWYEKLILFTLLSGSKTREEIIKHEITQKILSHKIPEAAFGIITPRILQEKEAKIYLSRKINGLRKKHILITEKQDRNLVYSIHPWFLPYLQQKLSEINEKDLIREIYRSAESSIRLLRGDIFVGRYWREWRDSLNNFKKMIKELIDRTRNFKSQLRFEVQAIPVSSIAEQYYCEKKVELAYMYGEEETKEILLGREAHEKLLEGTVKTKMESLWAEISSGLQVTVREMPLIGKYKDIYLIGIPDAVIFKDGEAKLLIEYKFTKSRYPWHDHHVQARMYCLLLHLIGFKTENLRYALILAPQECKGLPEIIDIERSILNSNGDKIIEKKIAGRIVRAFVNTFKNEEAKQELDWALQYWLKERDAIPTRKPNKCRICSFNDKCNHTLCVKPK